MCVGFHTAYFIFLLFYISEIKLFPNPFFGMFIFGCIGSGTSYMLDKSINDDGININNLYKYKRKDKTINKQKDKPIGF